MTYTSMAEAEACIQSIAQNKYTLPNVCCTLNYYNILIISYQMSNAVQIKYAGSETTVQPSMLLVGLLVFVSLSYLQMILNYLFGMIRRRITTNFLHLLEI